MTLKKLNQMGLIIVLMLIPILVIVQTQTAQTVQPSKLDIKATQYYEAHLVDSTPEAQVKRLTELLAKKSNRSELEEIEMKAIAILFNIKLNNSGSK